MVKQVKSVQDLEAQVNKRKKFLAMVRDLGVELGEEVGEQISYHQGNSHTNIVWEVKNVEGFWFFVSIGQSIMGGETIKVQYCPRGNPVNFDEGVLTLSFTVRAGDYVVKSFDSALGWQKALTSLNRNKDKVIKSILKKRRTAEKASSREKDIPKRLSQLKAEAKALML